GRVEADLGVRIGSLDLRPELDHAGAGQREAAVGAVRLGPEPLDAVAVEIVAGQVAEELVVRQREVPQGRPDRLAGALVCHPAADTHAAHHLEVELQRGQSAIVREGLLRWEILSVDPCRGPDVVAYAFGEPDEAVTALRVSARGGEVLPVGARAMPADMHAGQRL